MTIGTLVFGCLFVLGGLLGVHALSVWSDRRERARRRTEALRVLQVARRNGTRPRVSPYVDIPPRGASLAARPILSDDAESGDAGGYPRAGDAA